MLVEVCAHVQIGLGVTVLSELPLVSEGDSSVPEPEQSQYVCGDNVSSLCFYLSLCTSRCYFFFSVRYPKCLTRSLSTLLPLKRCAIYARSNKKPWQCTPSPAPTSVWLSWALSDTTSQRWSWKPVGQNCLFQPSSPWTRLRYLCNLIWHWISCKGLFPPMCPQGSYGKE